MPDNGEAATGPLDVSTLEVLARRSVSHPLVSGREFRPDSISPRVLELTLDPTQYPETIDAARIDVRWFVGGDYTLHYLEQHADDTAEPDTPWQCRWDRHPKPDASRAHFHPPPDATPVVEPSPIDSTHPIEVCFDVLEWIGGRIEALYE